MNESKKMPLSDRVMKATEAKKRLAAGVQVFGEHRKPERVRIQVRGETLDRGWRATNIQPEFLLHGVTAEELQQAIQELLAAKFAGR